MAAQAHTDRLRYSPRRHPEAVGPAGHQRQAGGGGEFGRRKAAAVGQGQPPPPGDFQHRWGRQGQQAMGGAHVAVASGWHTATHLAHPKMQQRGTDAHHIHQGVEGPDLMEMHCFRGMAMDPGFSLGQQQKNLPHLLR